jgi:hypothetical protein
MLFEFEAVDDIIAQTIPFNPFLEMFRIKCKTS